MKEEKKSDPADIAHSDPIVASAIRFLPSKARKEALMRKLPLILASLPVFALLVYLLSSIFMLREMKASHGAALLNQERRIAMLEKNMPSEMRFRAFTLELLDANDRAAKNLGAQKISPKQAMEIAADILSICDRNPDIELHPSLYFGLAERESSFNPAAISHDDQGNELAFGILQATMPTAEPYLKEMGYPNPSSALLLDPVICSHVGFLILIDLRREFKSKGRDSWHIALSGYYYSQHLIWKLLTTKYGEEKIAATLEYADDVLLRAKRYEEKGIA